MTPVGVSGVAGRDAGWFKEWMRALIVALTISVAFAGLVKLND